MPYHNAYKRVKEYLKQLLRPEVERHNTQLIENLKQLTQAQIVNGLRNQLHAYWCGEWPFDQQVKDGDPLKWWISLIPHPHARVLAVRYIFSPRFQVLIMIKIG
jgi:hypothetical protein